MRRQSYKKPYKKRGMMLKANVLLIACLGSISVIGCQPQNGESQFIAEQSLQPSATALSAINRFEKEYVSEMLKRQPSLPTGTQTKEGSDTNVTTDTAGANGLDSQSEEETLVSPESASSNSTISESTGNEIDSINITDNISDNDNVDTNNDSNNNDPSNDVADENDSITPKVSGAEVNRSSNSENESAEVSDDSTEVTLNELPLVEVDIISSEALTAEEHQARYQDAMQSLYLNDDDALSAQQIETLLTIATVVPDVFSNDELADRLVIKSPTLARLLKQYQLWEQAEAQKSAELEALKQEQIEEQQKQAVEFEALIKEFDETIKGYDEQIAKYEDMLKEFE